MPGRKFDLKIRPFYIICMKKKTILQRLQSVTAAELIAGAFVAIIFMSFVIACYLGMEWLRLKAPPKSIWSGAMTNMTSSIFILLLSWFAAVPLGNRLSSKLLPRTLKTAVSVAVVMRDFGFYNVGEFFNFVRLHNLPVYRVEKHLMDEPAENVRCSIEPLFGKAIFYSPLARDNYYANNLLCLELALAEKAISKTVQPIAKFKPEAVRAIVVEESERIIQSLREDIKRLNKDLGDKNREEGPFATAAKHRLFLIAQLFAAFLVRDQLIEDDNEGKPHTIKDIDKAYETFVAGHSGLKKLLSELKPDTKHDGFNKEISELVRISMAPGKVSWGGSTKTSLRSILKTIMIKKEREDFEEAYG